MSGIVPNSVLTGLSNGYIPVGIADSANLDAFSRFRVSSPTSLFSVQCQYNNAPLAMESGNTGTGVLPAHSANDRMVKLSCTAGSGTSFMQSFQYIPYQPGKSHLIFITGNFTNGVAGATVDAGIFDANNGLFFRQNGTSGMQIITRTSTSGSVVNNVINQSNWNIDTLDGNGPSGLRLDESRVFIGVIDAQFLGMGRVRLGFDIQGVIVYVHEFLNANNLAVPYMQTLTLPVQMLLTATSTATTKDCYFKCAAVISEGGEGVFEDFAFAFAVPECTVTAGNNARAHLMSLRPKTTFNSITNRETLLLDSVELFVTGNSPVYWELVLGQAITSPSYADVNATYSAFEYSNAGTLSGSPALVLASGYVASGASIKQSVSRNISSRYPITLDRAGAVRANGTLTLLVTGIGGTSVTRGSISFREIR